MNRRRCPLPDCTTPIPEKTPRATHVIKHPREVHNVPLEPGHGGNLTTQRANHGWQFRAWLIQNEYDPALDKFFTDVQDGLRPITGGAASTNTPSAVQALAAAQASSEMQAHGETQAAVETTASTAPQAASAAQALPSAHAGPGAVLSHSTSPAPTPAQ